MRLILLVSFSFLLLNSCVKREIHFCATHLKLITSDSTPTVGETLVLRTNNGISEYRWTGPSGFYMSVTGGSDSLKLENLTINQSGWYHCSAFYQGCKQVYDSIYIDVQYKQGTPSCSLTNNYVWGSAVPDMQASTVRKEVNPTFGGISVYASGGYGYPSYTFLFNSYNGNTEPKDGIYKTTNIQVFNASHDANTIYLECRYSPYIFQSHENQDVFVSHVNGKIRIAFCGLNFGGNGGTYTFTGQVTEL